MAALNNTTQTLKVVIENGGGTFTQWGQSYVKSSLKIENPDNGLAFPVKPIEYNGDEYNIRNIAKCVSSINDLKIWAYGFKSSNEGIPLYDDTVTANLV